MYSVNCVLISSYARPSSPHEPASGNVVRPAPITGSRRQTVFAASRGRVPQQRGGVAHVYTLSTLVSLSMAPPIAKATSASPPNGDHFDDEPSTTVKNCAGMTTTNTLNEPDDNHTFTPNEDFIPLPKTVRISTTTTKRAPATRQRGLPLDYEHFHARRPGSLRSTIRHPRMRQRGAPRATARISVLDNEDLPD
ncbi:hypothetical protein BDZ89DRAFT_1086338 [Hymenopellis radicata]|nr:hypothetical protein BDZ89DRAFT_1086338 [Hymenopellis radicata]